MGSFVTVEKTERIATVTLDQPTMPPADKHLPQGAKGVRHALGAAQAVVGQGLLYLGVHSTTAINGGLISSTQAAFTIASPDCSKAVSVDRIACA